MANSYEFVSTGEPCDITDVWTFERLKRPVMTWRHALYALYAPLGLCVLALRVVVLIVVMAALRCCVPLRCRQRVAAPLYLNVVGPLLGVWMRAHDLGVLDAALLDARARGEKVVLTCNHVTPLDPIFVAVLLGARRGGDCALVCRAMYDFFWKFLQSVGFLAPGDDALLYVHFFGTDAEREGTRGAVANEIAHHRERALLVFPEAVVSNRGAVLRYQAGVLGHPRTLLVPLALRVTFPWPVECTDPFGSFPATFVWWFFSPFLGVELRVCAAIRPEGAVQGQPQRGARTRTKSAAVAIALRAQLATAECLGRRAVTIDYKEKVRLNMALGTTPFAEFPRYAGATAREAAAGSLWFGGGREALRTYRAWLAAHPRVPAAAKATLRRLEESERRKTV